MRSANLGGFDCCSSKVVVAAVSKGRGAARPDHQPRRSGIFAGVGAQAAGINCPYLKHRHWWCFAGVHEHALWSDVGHPSFRRAVVLARPHISWWPVPQTRYLRAVFIESVLKNVVVDEIATGFPERLSQS